LTAPFFSFFLGKASIYVQRSWLKNATFPVKFSAFYMVIDNLFFINHPLIKLGTKLIRHKKIKILVD